MIEENIEDGKSEDTAKTTFRDYVDLDSNLICSLTTHRLVFLRNSSAPMSTGRAHLNEPTSVASFIPLSMVGCVSPKGLGFMASPKLKMTTYSYGNISLSFETSRDRDDMLSSLSRCLGRKAWNALSRQPKKKIISEQPLAARKVGVDAIMAKNRERHEEAKRISEDAFSKDVEGLMSEARDLVLIINKYVATLENKKKQESGEGNDQVDEEEQRLSEMLSNMGMMSAITKKSSGLLYHQQLARQISDFLIQSNFVVKQGGMVTLTDVYCLFNRARGANLISPDDMLVAASLLKELGLGYSKREFASGLVVLQSDDYEDEIVSIKLQNMSSKSRNGLTALFVSNQLKTNTILAMEQLQTAEELGYLCRDTTIEGIRFYENKFITCW